jgi:HEAT repeat protein
MKLSLHICFWMWLAIGGILLNAAAVQAAKLETADKSPEYIAVLKSDAPPHDKAMACRALATIGDDRAVEALASLLEDKSLATYARSALERIPGEAVDDALIKALGRAQGELRIGIINSIGRRGNSKSVEPLAAFISDGDVPTAAAAIRAVGRIGDSQAAHILEESLNCESAELRSIVAWACLDCAARRERQADKEQALSLCNAVRSGKLPKHIVLAASEQIVAIDGDDRHDLLASSLVSDDKQDFDAALQMARAMGANATPLLLKSYDRLVPERQLMVLAALGHQHDVSALEVIQRAIKAADPRIRGQAYASLAEFTTADALRKVLQGTADHDASVASSAREALTASKNDAVNTIIVAALREGDLETVSGAIEVAQERRIADATEPLFALMQNSRAETSLAALRALGSTVDLAGLPRLVEIVLHAPTEQRMAASEAITAACARLPQQECSRLLLDALSKSSGADRVLILQQLASVGDKPALQAVTEAANSNDEAQQDAAVRLLGKWPTPDAAQELFRLTSDSGRATYKTRALRGYIRIARQLDVPPEERLRMCENALRIAQRAEEKELVLDVLRRNPSIQGMNLAITALADKSLADAALAAIREIAPVVAQSNPTDAANALQLAQKHLEPGDQRKQLVEILSNCWKRAIHEDEANGFIPLFDGNSLSGWSSKASIFRAEQGEIVGGNLEDRVSQNEFLVHDATFQDFDLRLQAKVLGKNPNSGVQFRSKAVPDSHEVSGYQADMGQIYWGTLYDESRRRITLAGPPEDHRKDPVCLEDWNEYRIRCEGNRIQLWINGIQTVDFTESDPNVPQSGFIALQVHAGEPMEARFRDLRIKVLSH